MAMIVVTVAANGKEWHEGVGDRDGEQCQAVEHAKGCTGRFEHAHHIVYRSHLSKRSHWILENGIALSEACHALAHQTHNGNLDRDRCNAAVRAVNPFEDVKVKPFTRRLSKLA